jgi:hypothetical protein
MNQPCGCCTGIEIVTPESEINRPGLPALAYRAGTYATFFESMLARLSNLCIEVPSVDGSSKVPIYPLKQLTTRGPSDASIALLDAWAIVADVLTFYEERIANEGYLRTAVERRSILELARLVGYKLRPGVASSVYLAFTVSNGFQGDIPAETRAQSIPGTGEKPQFFETSEKLAARDAWNNLKPRLTRPQIITPPGTDPGKDNGPLATGADITDALYFKGTSTNLKVGDALLFVFGGDTKAQPAQQVFRFVESVNPQADQNRTQVTLVLPSQEISEPIDTTVKTAIQPFINKARTLFPDSDLAASIADALANLIGNVQSISSMIAARAEPTPGTRAADYVRGVVPLVQQSQDIAMKRGFTRLTAWTGHLLQILETLIEKLPVLSALEHSQGSPIFLRPALEASPLRNLYRTLDQLALPPSVQPPNSQRLPRTITQAFAPQSDVAPRLLATFKPAAAATLYQAWANVETPTSRVEVQAARVKAGLFASNFPGPPTVPARGKPVTFTAPNLGNAWNGLVRAGKNATGPAAVALDATYDQIKPGSWAAIDRPSPDGDKVTGRKVTMHRVMAVQTRTMDTGTGFTAKVTLLNVDPPWLSDSGNLNSDLRSSNVLRGAVVYAQTEPLNLAEELLDRDIEGSTIELADLYDGLESGRRIIVSGNRTDIANVSGVTASELVMIGAVNQGSQAAGCATGSPGFVPFSNIDYTTDANVFGDRLVVGRLSSGALDEIQGLPPIPNQAYCDQVQLAPGVYVNAYVPSADERQGRFPDFRGLLINPDTKTPYPEGTISPTEGGVFAWRISSEPVHTILNLASPLAYKYDASTVTLYGNVVNATHGQTVAEVLGNGDAGQSFQTFALHQSPLTYLSAPTQAGAESRLRVRVNEIEWHEQDDLAALGPKDRGFITQTNDADQTSVIFGNGEHGARPPSGSVNIKSVYRYGIGKPGNVKAQQISQLATRPLGAQGVINPLPATGGADRDSADQARRNTPLAVKALDRLVAVEDYADFARTFAGIGKAAATRLSDGRRQLVHVTIAGADDITIDINSDLYRNLVQALHQYGDPYLPIQVCVRKVKLLVISAGIRVRPDYQWESVEQLVRAAVVDAFSFERRELGQSAFLSEAMSLMQGVKGVAYVDVQVFDGVAEGITASQLAGLAGTLGRNPFVEADLAKLDPMADPAKPCERIRPAELVFLAPDIPDTLILTEITG